MIVEFEQHPRDGARVIVWSECPGRGEPIRKGRLRTSLMHGWCVNWDAGTPDDKTTRKAEALAIAKAMEEG